MYVEKEPIQFLSIFSRTAPQFVGNCNMHAYLIKGNSFNWCVIFRQIPYTQAIYQFIPFSSSVYSSFYYCNSFFVFCSSEKAKKCSQCSDLQLQVASLKEELAEKTKPCSQCKQLHIKLRNNKKFYQEKQEKWRRACKYTDVKNSFKSS